MKTYKIAVAGTGYVGLSLSVLLAQHNQVMAVDIVQSKVDMINNHKYTKELWIDRRENSKSLAWSSVLLALGNVKEVGAVVDRPKALGDIRGVTYIYGVFYRFGLIDVPDKVKEKMNKCGCVAKS